MYIHSGLLDWPASHVWIESYKLAGDKKGLSSRNHRSPTRNCCDCSFWFDFFFELHQVRGASAKCGMSCCISPELSCLIGLSFLLCSDKEQPESHFQASQSEETNKMKFNKDVYVCRGSEYGPPQVSHFGTRITLSWRQLRKSRDRQSFLPLSV